MARRGRGATVRGIQPASLRVPELLEKSSYTPELGRGRLTPRQFKSFLRLYNEKLDELHGPDDGSYRWKLRESSAVRQR